MQKLVYLSNSRDYSEQGNINENRYFTQVNKLLAEGWKVIHMTHDVVERDNTQTNHPMRKETYMSFVLLEKDGKEKRLESLEEEN